MKQYFKDTCVYVLLTVLFLAALGWAVCTYDKAAIHLWMNSCHTPVLDTFFRYYTYVGEWVPYVVVFALLFYKAGWASVLLTDVLFSGLIAQRLKYVFNTDRPYMFFQNNYPDVQLPLVDGVRLSQYYSCPSGHTTTFFAMMMVLTLVVVECYRQRQGREGKSGGSECCVVALIGVCMFVLAVLGAYSRIYLSQHFAEDIFAGAIIGVLSTVLLLFFVPKLEKTTFFEWNFRKMHLK